MNSENELDTTCGVSDEELTRRFREAVRIENEIKKSKDCRLPGMTMTEDRHTSNIQMGDVSMRKACTHLKNQLHNLRTPRS